MTIEDIREYRKNAIERLKKQDQHATANAVDLAFDSLLALDQIMAERDIAFELLERFDIILGQNADYIKYLIEKDNPKQLVNYDNCGNKCASTRCPNCFEMIGNNYWKYCPECGQKIKESYE